MFIQCFGAARPVGVENSFYEPQLPRCYWISSNARWLFHRRFPWGSVSAVDIPKTRKKFSLIVGCTWTPDFINLQNFQLAIRLTVLTTGESDNFYGSLFSRFCFARKFRVNQTERFSNDDVSVAMVIREIELLLLGVHGRMKSRFCCEYQAAVKRNFSLDSCCVFSFFLRSSNMCVWEMTV